jgi:hypothetical protein
VSAPEPSLPRLVRRIVWRGQGTRPFASAALGFLLGFAFLLMAVQLYDRVYSGLRADLASGELSRYLVLHKRVGTAQVMGRANPNFNAGELDELRAQPFVEDAAPFRANSFSAALTLEQFPDMQVLVPLESVDDAFLDTVPANFTWEPGQDRIPVVISSEFLNLYNAVLAPSMNYPRFTREFVMSYPLEILLLGNGRRANMRIRVVGFSDRILSVLVPPEFLTWANDTYGSGTRDEYARVIARVADPGDPAFRDWMARKDYETGSDALQATAAGALQAVLGVLGVLGLLFLALALVIFIMAFELTISRARAEIDLLIQLGHPLPSLVRAVLGAFVPGVLGLAAVALAGVVVAVRQLGAVFARQGFPLEPGIWWGVWAAAALFVGAVLALSAWSVRRSLNRVAR